MTTSPQGTLLHPGFSHRVRPLFVAMLKILVKSEFGYLMRDGEASDLAQYHSLRGAIGLSRRG